MPSRGATPAKALPRSASVHDCAEVFRLEAHAAGPDFKSGKDVGEIPVAVDVGGVVRRSVLNEDVEVVAPFADRFVHRHVRDDGHAILRAAGVGAAEPDFPTLAVDRDRSRVTTEGLYVLSVEPHH